MTIRQFRSIPSDLAPRNPNFMRRLRNVVVSRKMQLWLIYHNIDLDFVSEFERRKQNYLEAKTTENIAQITAIEIERCLHEGTALPDKRRNKK